MINKFLTLLENPIIVIALTIIIIAVILTQKNIVGKLLRKYLNLNTDEETIKFLNKVDEKNVSFHTETQKHNFLKEFKKTNLIGGRPDDR